MLEGLGSDVDWEALDQALELAGKWAARVAGFRHPRIAAVKLARDPNDKAPGEQSLEQLRQGIMQDLEKLADAGVIDLEALATRTAKKRPN